MRRHPGDPAHWPSVRLSGVAIERASQHSDSERTVNVAVSEPSLGEVVRQLVNALQPEQIYLFGSRARRDSLADSDYDFMVIVRESDLPPHRRAQLAHLALHRIRVAADILVSTRQEFDRFLSV